MYNEPKRDLFFILIASAVLHLVFLVLMLLSKLDDTLGKYKKHLIAAKERKEKTAQVIFKQPPQKKLKRMTPKLVAGAPSLSAPVGPPPKPENKKPPVKKEKPKPRPAPKKKPVKKPKPPIKIVKKEKAEPKPVTKKEPVKKPEPPVKIEKKEEPPAPKKLTLADISKGFMDYARKDGAIQNSKSNHLVTVKGKTFGQATADQLKHERYIKKLFDCIDVAFKLHRRNFRFTQIPQIDPLRVVILVDLQKNGMINSINIIKKSGNTQFDLFMPKVIKDAARSFPPVPSAFKTDIYSLPIEFAVSVASLCPTRGPQRI